MKRLQQSKHALGSEVVLTVVVEDGVHVEEIFDQLWREVRLFEATFSRFLPDSELSYVNQQAGSRVGVSPEFLALAKVAKAMAQTTGGLYNPFVLPQLQAAGYKGSWPNPKEAEPGLDFTSRQIVAATQLKLGTGWLNMPSDAALDFGGIGKGYLLDRLAEMLPADSGGYWLSLGGDILCSGHDVDGKPWKIGIENIVDGSAIAYVKNAQGKSLAIATSGILKRRGEGWHHIIDPRTGKPAQTDVQTATVCARSGTEADIFAKCLVIVGSQQAKQFATAHKVTASLVQYRDTSGTIVRQLTGNLFSS